MAKTVDSNTKTKIAKAVLGLLGISGLLVVGAIAPNTIQLLGPLVNKSKRGLYNRRYYIKSTISRLAKQDLISFKKSKSGQIYASLTDKGKHRLLKYRLEELTISKPLRWDRKWRIVIFDIKEFKRTGRDQLRNELINIGFSRLQNSVWVYPYECDEFVTLLKTYYGFGKSLLYLEVGKLENDSWLRKNFDL